MNLIQRAKNILVTPKTEWNVVAGETATLGSLLTGYVLPLSLIPAVAGFLGTMLFAGFFFGPVAGIVLAVVSVIGSILAYVIGTYIIDALAPSFKSEKDLGRSAQLMAYSATAIWVAGVLSIIPLLGWLAALAGAAYSIYLMYLGLGPIKKTPEDQRVLYVIIAIVVYWVVNLIITMLIGGLIVASVFSVGASMMKGAAGF
jgi:hypothetical protein